MFGIRAFPYSGKLYEGICKTQHETKDKEIQTLLKAFPLIIKSGLAATTNKKYFHGWNNLVNWSSIKQGAISCQTDPFYVTTYLNHVLFVSGAKGSIITAFFWNKMGSSDNEVELSY